MVQEWILEMYDQEETGAIEAAPVPKEVQSPLSCYDEEVEEEEDEDGAIVFLQRRSAVGVFWSAQDSNPIWAQKLSGASDAAHIYRHRKMSP